MDAVVDRLHHFEQAPLTVISLEAQRRITVANVRQIGYERLALRLFWL